MISVMCVICATIVICTFIKYRCIWKCQQQEYRLYREKNKKSPFVIRPHLYKHPHDASKHYWGYVVFNTDTDHPYTGIDKNNTSFTVYREKADADKRRKELDELYEYN
ncbi:hypothetical protein SEPL_498 [Salmonella phage SE_PL]|uniref:hypothetical protein n=1 Tax=Salmonella enterica TaxID=28901 RepID=UPI000FDF6FC8|nr:hypothetical protein CPT_Munch_470 [Salmonella phage Munch]EAZ2022742.1 hypothetical protein [Salmonella enterica]ECV9083876.1 hypothetical protein [Salmonella enterica subsp. enterica serovar Infantis]MCP0435528.1 hypothetical protein [Salmonella enterica subsp. enterica serovar Mbandaka]QCW18573.1 hypothetical protein 7t3_052 [Salmonella phage 7t3]QIG63111.1 hypothetical protein SEPL_498 [Salmonella phage SE_PL]